MIAAGYADNEYFAMAVTFEGIKGISSVFPFRGNFTPIGSQQPFIGHYDGNGHSITGLKVASVYGQVYKYAGLFSCTSHSTLYDITIRSVTGNTSYFISAAINSLDLVNVQTPLLISGGIAGDIWNTKVAVCSADAVVSSFIGEGFVSSVLFPSKLFSGGLIGNAEKSAVTDSTSAGSVSSVYLAKVGVSSGANLRMYTGGAVGSSVYTDIKRIWNAAWVQSGVYCRLEEPEWFQGQQSVYIDTVSMLGGIAGNIEAGEITDAYNTGGLAAIIDADLNMTINSLRSILLAGGCTPSGSARNTYNAGQIGLKESFNAKEYNNSLMMYGISPDSENSYCLYSMIPPKYYDVECTMISATDLSRIDTFYRWDFDRIWKMSNGHPELWVRYDLEIIDNSLSGSYKRFDGVPRYSVDREYEFDRSGTLHSYTGKEGFAVELEKEYELCDITLYTVIDDRKVILKKDGNNNYMIPSAFILSGYPELILHLDGFEQSVGEPSDESPDEPSDEPFDEPPVEKSVSGVTPHRTRSLMPVLLIFTAVIIMTACNAASVMSIMRSCSRRTEELRGGQNEQT